MKLGKRFSGMILVGVAITVGFLFGPADAFPSFASAMGLIYGAYLGGQSATDWKHGGGSSAQTGPVNG